jgi:hypothetical protein
VGVNVGLAVTGKFVGTNVGVAVVGLNVGAIVTVGSMVGTTDDSAVGAEVLKAQHSAKTTKARRSRMMPIQESNQRTHLKKEQVESYQDKTDNLKVPVTNCCLT